MEIIMTKLPMFLSLTIMLLAQPVLANEGHDSKRYGKLGDPKQVTRTINLTATEIAFNTKSIKVKKGETVKFVLANKGEQNHEMTIGDAASQKAHRKMMETMTMEDMNKMGHKHTSSVDTKPGQTKSLVWTFTEAGQFEFACNYPGHADLGMKGKILVE
jgi:uncharacterized cupredoxin-like copper-binding protein